MEVFLLETTSIPIWMFSRGPLRWTEPVAKALPSDRILVAITESKDVEKCYGIPADKFMELAVELDPKSRAALDTEEAETEAE